MSEILNHSIIPFVEHFKHYAVWIAFAAAFGETLFGLGFLLPGSTLLLLLGVLAGQGYFDITALMLFAVTGAYLGDITNYHLGKHYGSVLLGKSWMPLSNEQLRKAHKFLNTHGAKSVFLARFLPAMKESIPFLAGSLKMKRSKFLFWDFLGAIGWSLEFMGTGYLFSASLALAQVWLSRTVTVIALLIFLLMLLYLLKQFVVHNAHSAKIVLLSLGHSFLQNPFISGMMQAHPKFTAFIRSRFDKTTFYGLPLTLFTMAIIFVSALFGGIVEDFLSQDPIVYVDHIVANLMVGWRTPEMTTFFTWITYLGKKEVILFFLAAVTVILVLYKKYDDLISLYISFIGSATFLYLGKLAFHRPRPETALYFESSYSFPSGHATLAVAFYGFLGYLLIRYSGYIRTKVNLFFVTTILLLLIGLSRIYLGEHYISDIYSGFLLGTLWVIIAIALLQWLECKKFFTPGKSFKFAKSASLLVLSAAAGFYLVFGAIFHYKPAIHLKEKIVQLDKISTLFKEKSDGFAQNIFGMDSQPVNLIITAGQKEDLCTRLQQAGWKMLNENKRLNVPIFWHAKEPLCGLYKKRGDTVYLLRIWNTYSLYENKKVYAAGANAVVNWYWDIVPVFVKDIDNARDFAGNDLKEYLHAKMRETLQLNTPFIQENLLGTSYFSNGEANFLLLE